MMDMDPDKLKVPELREALTNLGLDSKGLKPVLVTRLKEHLSSSSASAAADYDPTEPTEDTDPQTEFGDKNFVSVTPKGGISFSLTAPRPAKPAPPPRPVSPGPQLETSSSGIRRAGAAAFFLSEVERLNSGESKTAKVPLPPSFGYQVDDDDDEEEDGPPGMVPLKLPAIKFDKPFTKDLPKDNVESWRRIDMPDLYNERRRPEDWSEGVVLQDPALFLQEEAGRLGAELTTEVEHTDVPGLSLATVKMKVTYNYLTARAQAKTRREAMDQCALKILKDSGPWLDPDLVNRTSETLAGLLPKSVGSSWLPPRYNIKHVRLVERDNLKQAKRLYEMTIKLGPLSCSGIGDTVEDSLQYTSLHLKSFIKNRDLTALRPLETGGRLTYASGLGIVRVVMEDKSRDQVVPPLDLFILQTVLKDGAFPPLYCGEDVEGCIKVFCCDVCGHRMVGADSLIQHVQGERHNNRLGKFIFNGKTIETFRSSADPQYGRKIRSAGAESEAEQEKYILRLCSSCEEEGKVQQATANCKDCNDYMCALCRDAHTKTRLTKNHEITAVADPVLVHPVVDRREGRKVSEEEKYLIRVYRCPTRIKTVGPAQTTDGQDGYAGDEFEGEEYVDEGGLGEDCYQDYHQGYEGFRRKKLYCGAPRVPGCPGPLFHSLVYTMLNHVSYDIMSRQFFII